MRNKKLIAVLIVVCSITLLIILNSVIFSVREVSAYCYNERYEDVIELSQRVVDNSGIKKGDSIFTLNKKKVIDTLSKNVEEIKVINIEKKAPNKVFINYVKIEEYLRIEKGGAYYFCSNDGKIMSKRLDKGPDDSIIELRLSKPITNTEAGQLFASESASDAAIVSELLTVLEWRLEYPRDALVKMINFIDISKNQYIFIGTEAGVVMELQGVGNLANKLRYAFSVYERGLTVEQQQSGTIIVPDGNPTAWTYSEKDHYKEIIS